MFVNEFESSNAYRLQQIVSTLKNVHGVEVDFNSQDDEQIRALGESSEIIKNSIVKESAFNSWMQNPEYTKNMLILEAVRIYLTEIAPKRRPKRKVKEGIEHDDYSDDDDSFVNLRSGCYVRDSQEGRNGEVFKMIGSPHDRRVQIVDRDGRGWNVAPHRLIPVPDGDPGIARYFGNEDIDETSPESMLKMSDLGRAMMDYAQKAAHNDDDKELRILNAISQVGDKLTQLGTPFGPRTLTDMDKKVIYFAKKRMGMDPSVEEDVIQPKGPNGATDNNKPAPGMINVQKGTDKKTVPAAQVANLQKQGYSIVGDDNVNEETIEDLMVRYGVNESQTVNEAMHMETHDYQASMARSELYRNTKYAMDMMKMIGPEDDIKPWIAANLTKAAESLDKIFHYMDYHMTFEPEGEEPAPMNMDEDAEPELGETTGSTARQNLVMIIEYSTKLFRMIQPGDKLEGWVAMKLTNASEAISSSKHYMDYAQFEKHVGHGVSDFDPSVSPVGESKKRSIKEGKMVNIGNILMNAMIKEDQDLDQAETLLAAKSMSDELQGIAEKLAKMSVEELMPLVDTMKEQFGQEIATGFNDTMKAALEAVLNSATEAKETADNAILSMQQGQVPGAGATDIETAAPAGNDEEPSTDFDDDFGGTPAAAGPEDEPLGRSKKPEAESPAEIEESRRMVSEKWDTKMKTADKDKGKWDGYTIAELKAKKKKLMDKKERTAAEQKTVKQIDFAIRAKQKDKWGKVDEAKKAKPDFLDVDKDGDKKEPMKKALKDKAKKKVNESYKSVNFGPNMGSLAQFDPKLSALAKNIEAAIDAEQNLTDEEKGALANILSHMAGFASDPRGWEDAEEKMTNAISAVQHALDPRKPEARKIINAMKKLAHGISFKHEEGGVMEGKKAKPDFLDVDKDGDKKEPMKKALKDKAKKSKVEESAPAGKKAEDFIKQNKADFKQRYGDKGEEVLYATAWKKFGHKSESVIKTAKMLEAAKANKAKLEKMFEAHKRQYKKMVSEGVAFDPLNTGYGLEGETLLDQITDVNGMISKLKEMMRAEMQAGIRDLVIADKKAEKAGVLESKKAAAPYGVIWKNANGRKQSKFFETADLRKYWVNLNKDMLSESKLVNPEDFDKRIKTLSTRKG